jgi:hypothetical protein
VFVQKFKTDSSMEIIRIQVTEKSMKEELKTIERQTGCSI